MLKPVWIVGFTGHRPADGPGRSAEQLRACREPLKQVLGELQEQARTQGGSVELFTGAAAGADLEAAEAAGELGIPVHVILPMPVEMFEGDFSGDLAADWPRAQRWIKAGQNGDAGGTFRIARGDNTRSGCYHEASVQMLQSIDLLIAVCNDQPSGGVGGSAETIEQAKELNLPIVRINPAVDGQIERLNNLDRWAEHNQITREVMKVCSVTSPRGAEPTCSEIKDVASALSKQADRMGKGFRRRLFVAIGLHLLAAVLATTTAAFSPVIHHHQKAVEHGDAHAMHIGAPQILTAIELVLVSVALWLTVRTMIGHMHHGWRQCRFATEIVRSLRATAGLLDPLEPLILRHTPKWRRIAVSVALLAHRCEGTSSSHEKRLERYLKDRVVDQRDGYYKPKLKESQPWATRFAWMGKFATITAPVFIGVAFGIKLFKPDLVEANYGAAILASWLPVFIPLVAAFASTLLIAGDFARRKERYHIMIHRLNRSYHLLSTLKTPGAVYHHVEETEEILLDELVEWHTAAKNMGH